MTDGEKNDLKEALGQMAERDIAALHKAAEAEPHVFSRRFERRMYALIHSRKQACVPTFKTAARRVAVFVAALFLFTTVTAVNVEGLRAPLFSMVQQVFDKFSIISYQSAESVPETSFAVYGLSKIPDGFHLEEHYDNPNIQIATDFYKNSDGSLSIEFRQMDIHHSFGVNTEGAEQEEFVMDGLALKYLSNRGIQSVFWNNNEYSYFLSGNISKEMLLDLVKSVKLVG